MQHSLVFCECRHVGAGVLDGPAEKPCVFTLGFGENEMHAVRADMESAPTIKNAGSIVILIYFAAGIFKNIVKENLQKLLTKIIILI